MGYSFIVNIVWGTASTGGYGGTVFPGGVRYSLVNNVCGVRYSLGYRIHSDTGYLSLFLLLITSHNCENYMNCATVIVKI